jgi:hypothetical protein
VARDAANLRAADVLREVMALAFSDVMHFEIDAETGDVKLAAGAPAYAFRALAGFEKSVRQLPRGGRAIKVKLKLWSKIAALRMAGQHLGMWSDAVNVDLDELIDRELARVAGQGHGAGPGQQTRPAAEPADGDGPRTEAP